MSGFRQNIQTGATNTIIARIDLLEVFADQLTAGKLAPGTYLVPETVYPKLPVGATVRSSFIRYTGVTAETTGTIALNFNNGPTLQAATQPASLVSVNTNTPIATPVTVEPAQLRVVVATDDVTAGVIDLQTEYVWFEA